MLILRGDGLCMSREQSGDGWPQAQASKQQAGGQKRGMPGSALHKVCYACILQLLWLLVEYAVQLHTLLTPVVCAVLTLQLLWLLDVHAMQSMHCILYTSCVLYAYFPLTLVLCGMQGSTLHLAWSCTAALSTLSAY